VRSPLNGSIVRQLAIAGASQMKLDVYGRFQLEVLRENNSWVAYRVGPGTRSRDTDVVIPNSLAPEEIAGYLDDLFHELSGFGQTIRVLS
jgi:hypothetical protein